MFVWAPLLIALCIGPTSARGHAAPPIPPPVVIDATNAAPDPWFAEDKLRHFFMSFAATSFAYGAARTAGLDHGPAEVAAGVGAAAAGVWKEFHDRSHGRRFSFRDLAWNGVGIAAALILAAQTR